MDSQLPIPKAQEPGTYLSYFAGFIISVGLTLAAYVPVSHLVHASSGPDHLGLTIVVIGLAIVQLLVQLVFFLHLGRESKPRWRSWALVFAVLVVLVIVGGSLWIMNNLDYRMTPQQLNQYLQNQDGGI